MKASYYIIFFVGVFGIGIDLGLVLIFLFYYCYMPKGGLPWGMVPWYLYVAGTFGLLITNCYIGWWFLFRKNKKDENSSYCARGKIK